MELKSRTIVSQRRHLENKLQELERKYDSLTKRIRVVDTDIDRALDGQARLVLDERLKELSVQRDETAAKIDEMARKLELLEKTSSSEQIVASPSSTETKQRALPSQQVVPDHEQGSAATKRRERDELRPTVLVASSAESRDIAHLLGESILESGVANVLHWENEDLLRPSSTFLETLRRQLKESDFAVFVLAPDNAVRIKGVKLRKARDSVMFALGICSGTLGAERSIVLAVSDTDLRKHLIAQGVTLVSYSVDQVDASLETALTEPCEAVCEIVNSERFFPRWPTDKVRNLNGPIHKDRLNDDSQYMITDANALLDLYEREKALWTDEYRLPYNELRTWDIRLDQSAVEDQVQVKYTGEFSLKYRSMSHKLFQVQAYAEFIASGRLTKEDRPLVRLDNFTVGQDGARDTVEIQEARYSDQVQSNFVLHWPTVDRDWFDRHGLDDPFRHATSYKTLAKMLLEIQEDQSRWQLPPIGGDASRYLANTIGVAIILFYRKEKKWVPIVLNRQDEKVTAVFSHGRHVTASFALQFLPGSDKAISLEALVLPQLKLKITDEALIRPEELGVLSPLALCREFMRGGKPQLFYAGYVKDIQEEDLVERLQRKGRTAHIYQRPEEIDKHLRPSSDEHLGPTSQETPRYTTEFMANWYYCKRLYLPKLEAFGLSSTAS